MNFKGLILCLGLLAGVVAPATAQYENYKLYWKSISKKNSYNATPDWLNDAKFGRGFLEG